MDAIKNILGLLEIPFPLAFTFILSIALYALGGAIKKKSEDPESGVPPETKYKITAINLVTGMVVATIYHVINYFITVQTVSLLLVQYVVVGLIAGMIAAGISTHVYELLKNKLKLESFRED